MKVNLKSAWIALGIVLGWRFALLVFTAQPITGNDAFLFDGAVINWLLHGQYFNPSLAECFPISGREVFAAYPPIYQGLLLLWMSLFGTSVLSVMWLHFACTCVSGALLVKILQSFPASWLLNLAPLFLFAVTFDDRPEGLAHVFGLAAIWVASLELQGRIRWASAQAWIVVALFCSLYTSVIVGALYCAIVILTGLAAWLQAGHKPPWAAALGVVLMFCGVTFWIAQTHPLWWQGFLENARQTPVSTTGFRLAQPAEVIKIVRNAPVFLLALAFGPWLWRKFHRTKSMPENQVLPVQDLVWLSLSAGLTVAGVALLFGALTLTTSNYVIYLWHLQVLLAAGLIAAAAKFGVRFRQAMTAVLACCLALVSVRAVGMTTWGVFCATDVSHRRARAIVAKELQPFVKDVSPVSVSSAFLYQAASMRVRRPLHSDWAYDRRGHPPGTELWLLNKIRPAKLVITQFDFYRIHAAIIEELGRHPELGSARVRNTASIPVPDSSPSLQRVLQHISWAPVIVDFSWK